MNLSNKAKVFILSIILLIISVVFIIINGNTYTIKNSRLIGIDNIDELEITIENENVIECVDKRIKNGVLEVKVKSKSEGKTNVIINKPDDMFVSSCSLYVHKFGVITYNEFMGYCNGCIIIPISISILLIYILLLLINSYKKSVKKNIYQYKNIIYLGLIVFITFSIISQILSLFNYMGLIDTIDDLLNMFSVTLMLLPLIFIVSILVILSNILLIRKEGFNVNNVLGIILGVFLCSFTLLPEIMYKLLYSATWFDIHNQNRMPLYIYNSINAIINIIITYIECILIGTIIMGLKASRYKPSFDKDAIIILGCQIKKDGTLTKLLKGRVDKAIEFSKMQKDKTNKDILFVPSGGKGNDEIISEALAMKNYLLEKGIKEESILIEDKSKNTYENISFSNKIINKKIENAKIVFATTNYHVLRAGSIATEQNIYMEGVGAKTKSYFWINAFIREFIATLVNEKKKHIAVVLSIIFIAIFMIYITYLNNNI